MLFMSMCEYICIEEGYGYEGCGYNMYWLQCISMAFCMHLFEIDYHMSRASVVLIRKKSYRMIVFILTSSKEVADQARLYHY